VEFGTIFWTLLLTALTTGLMGSLHCLGMCGGISATVALASPLTGRPHNDTARPVPVAVVTGPAPARAGFLPTAAPSTAEANVLAFNAGRIASYAIAGALAGTLGGALAGLGQGWVINETAAARTALFLLANLMIIFTGLYLMGLPQLLAPLEKAGGHLWRRVSPYAQRLLPLRTVSHAALFGMLWGWIPCGMVYAMLLTAMSAGSAAGGALTMFAFGAGTLPVMLGAGWSAGRLRGWTRRPRVRLAAGIAVVAMGVFGLARTGTLAQLQAFGAFCMTLIPAGTPLVTP
jgi:sulfite exporter TauE/SafE